ncbi:trypsin 5G1-like [Belonocnema kinseyi]|uniref:trypsin 5G1-like n=1 Tax=Belonocnema kinseyi TaxID=2817044 RepID=UPI00143DDF36|nr:trypsin 5G1-like [Belonocnema kinseyi]
MLIVTLGSTESIPFVLRQLNPFTPSGRIVGGSDVSIKEVPYQVALEVNYNAFCGGSIIDEYWVITAGHCILYPEYMVTIRAGSEQKGTGGSSHKVEKIIKHEGYQVNRFGIPFNDLALIKVETPFKLDGTRQPIPLFEREEAAVVGTLATITGWGALKEYGRYPEVLQTTCIPIVSKKVCNRAYRNLGGVPPTQICAALPIGGKDACQGDSGGPLAINGRLAGIVSWGNGCAKAGFPGAYTSIAAYRNWIDKNLGLNFDNCI